MITVFIAKLASPPSKPPYVHLGGANSSINTVVLSPAQLNKVMKNSNENNNVIVFFNGKVGHKGPQ